MQDWYTVKQIADNLQLSVATIIRKIKAGDLKANKIGGVYRISESQFLDYINRHRAQCGV